MARLRSGILGNIRGKVAGVVGGQWKDVNYIREYVKPANPNSAAQQTQRTKMSDCVAFAKTLVGPIFNVFTDKFQKSMSGFNAFVKANIAVFDGTPDYSAIKVTEGKLSPITAFVVTYNTADGDLIAAWTANNGNNGEDTDGVYLACYDESTGLWYFSIAMEQRSVETKTDVLPTGLTAGNLHCYAVISQYSGVILDLVADSVYDLVEVP
jgi:hypothetical protein